MDNYHSNVFLQKVARYFSYAITNNFVLSVPTIKNTKLDGDLTSPNNAVSRDTIDSDGEQINASEEKLKEVMKEMNQALNMLSGSAVTPNSATNQVVIYINIYS